MAEKKEPHSGEAGDTIRRKQVLRVAYILAVVVALIFVQLFVVGYALKRIAVGQIRSLTGGRVEVGSISINTKGWVHIEDLSIGPHKKTQHESYILTAENLTAHFAILSLLKLNPLLKEIKVENFVLDAQYDSNSGRWNLDALDMQFPQGRAGEKPVVHLNNGTLRYSKVVDGKVDTVMEIPLDVSFGPAELPRGAYQFKITTAKRKYFGPSSLNGLWKPGRVIVTGSVSTTDLSTLERVWTVHVLAAELKYDQQGQFDLILSIKDMVTKELKTGTGERLKGSELFKRKVLAKFQKILERYNPSGRFDFKIHVSGNRNHLSDSMVQCNIECKDVTIIDRKFPYRLEHLTGNIGVDLYKKRIEIDNLNGEHDDVVMRFNGFSQGFGENREYEFKISSENMALNKALYEALPSKYEKLWDTFSPSGQISIEYHINRGPQRGREKLLVIKPLGADASYRRFPYPMRNLHGLIKFDGENATVSDLKAQYDGRQITINGLADVFGDTNSRYNFTIKAKDLPLDSTFEQSLPKPQRHFFNKFRLAGITDADVKVFTPGADGATKYTADVYLRNGSFIFPYSGKLGNENIRRFPVSGVTAKVVFTPEMIGIERLSGSYNSSPVSLKGRIWLNNKQNSEYCLSLRAEQLGLKDKVAALLPENIKKAISKLNFKGKINVGAHLNGTGKEGCDQTSVTVDCLKDTVEIPLKDEAQNYCLKGLTGSLKFAKNKVSFTDVTAVIAEANDTQEQSKIWADGALTLSKEKITQGTFQVSGKDVRLDERLGQVLPSDMQAIYEKLSPTGYIDFKMNKFLFSSDIGGDKSYEFSGTINLNGCHFQDGKNISDVNTRLRIEGKSTSGAGFTGGKVTIPSGSFRFKGKKITNLESDIYFVSEKRNWFSRHFTGEFYGGGLTGKFMLDPCGEGSPEYKVHLGFEHADLQSFLSDVKPETEQGTHTTGRMSGWLTIKGRMGNSGEMSSEAPYSRTGICKIRITDMHLGKVSPLAKLLYVLKLTKPKSFAFDKMVLHSYIQGRRLYFEKFDLSGPAIAFTGKGWMDTESKEVSLVLFARGKRVVEAKPTMFQSLTESLGTAVVRMQISGTISEPKIKAETLPVIKEAFGVLGR